MDISITAIFRRYLLASILSAVVVLPVGAETDPLWLPATGKECVLTAHQEQTMVMAPNEKVKEAIRQYAAWYREQADRTYTVREDGKSREYTGQQLANKKFIEFVHVRVHFYEWCHRYDQIGTGKKVGQMSYANQKLQAFATALERTIHGTGAAETKVDLWTAINNQAIRPFDPEELLIVESAQMKDVGLPELRTYANEVLLFAVQQTMQSKAFAAGSE